MCHTASSERAGVPSDEPRDALTWDNAAYEHQEVCHTPS